MLFSPVTNVVTAGLTEGVAYLNSRAERVGYRARAATRAEELDVPLVVVRGPRSSVQCGSAPCVSVRGCAECGVGAVAADDQWSDAHSHQGGSVVLVDHALEHVDDVEEAWRQIRAAARDDSSRIFVAKTRGWATWSRVASGAKRIIDAAPPESPDLKYHAVRREPRTVILMKRAR
jgi:hypothetical protein